MNSIRTLEKRFDGLSVDVLLTLRSKLDEAIRARGAKIASDLRALERLGDQPARKTLKGIKVPPKYRGPDGETWAGRGEVPRWLRALAKTAKAREQYLIGARRSKAR